MQIPDAPQREIWSDTRLVPVYASACSAFMLLLRFTTKLLKRSFFKANNPHTFDGLDPAEDQTSKPGIESHIQGHGGLSIFTFSVVRFFACCVLLTLSVYTFITRYQPDQRVQAVLTGAYGYALLLALASVFCKAEISRTMSRHLVLVLLTTWAVFVYRDLWPLATYTLTPLDAFEGWLIWVKIGVLTVAAVVIPLLIPRPYIPIDPKRPALEPNPEQTASILSLIFYTFLDPIVLLGNRLRHLSSDKLPTLSDYDRTENVVKRGLQKLDPLVTRRNRHVIIGLLDNFATEFSIMALTLSLRVVTSFAGPIGIYRLLNYLSRSGPPDIVRPWVWIAWLAVGPILNSILNSWYIFVANRMRIQMEALITQLVFNHALRIRVKADVGASSSHGVASTTAISSDSLSLAEEPDTGEDTQAANSDAQNSSGRTEPEQRAVPTKPGLQTKETKEPETRISIKSPQISNVTGRLLNLMTSDMNSLIGGIDWLHLVITIPFQAILCICFLYAILGWSSMVGLSVILIMLPVPGYIAKVLQKVQAERMKNTDARVGTVSEAVQVIRMIKMFGWESKTINQIAEKRENELVYLKRFRLLELSNGLLNFAIPVLTMVFTFIAYTVFMKQDLTASRVFSSMSVFQMLRDNLRMIFGMIPTIVEAKVSGDRVNDFLLKTELLDSYAGGNDESSHIEDDSDLIGIREAVFTWTNENDGTSNLPISGRGYALQIEDTLTFKNNAINIIIGPTGSGKTALLLALLGELHFEPLSENSYFHLPRHSGVAYAAQESWVQNETIRNNILFGSSFDEDRYNKVLYQCALKFDLSLLTAGDNTEVGEKGLTLSGGQKTRITLARAIYSSAKTLLLDDIFASLDSHTATWIVEKCLKGDLLRGRTVLLVTHNIHVVRPIADFVVSLEVGGRIATQGSVKRILSKGVETPASITEEGPSHATPERAGSDIKSIKAGGTLVVSEEISEGHVGWDAIKLYLTTLGSNRPFVFWSLFLGGLLLTGLTESLQSWYMGFWAAQYETHNPSDVNVVGYIALYFVLLCIMVCVYLTARYVFVYGSLAASRTIHERLISSVMRTTLRWIDMTPTSRIITRCTQDIQAVDGPISSSFRNLLEMTASMLVKFAAVVIIAPVFILPGILVAILGAWCGQIYMHAQLAVKREMSNARAPVVAHLGAAMSGLVSLRAYGAQTAFKLESYKRIDAYSLPARTFFGLNRWIAIRIDMLSGFFAAALAAYLVYFSSAGASNTGFSLNMAVGFTGMLLWWIRNLNDLEVSGNSLERIQQYIDAEQELEPAEDGIPPAYWPTSGELIIENLYCRYSPDGPDVLQDISCHIKSGERIGIVGRTGSGKSTFTLALLRCILTRGTMIYDGIPMDTINLDCLRSNITIIPQTPELLHGTLRQNLDPFSQYEDVVLYEALRVSGFFSVQDERQQNRLTLDSVISSGGSNLSLGQRQILSLARALVRQSKLLIMDEATSAIDYETDMLIQTSLRQRLGKDVTVLIVAHRLQTIMDADRIMVLNAGRLVEFDKPSELLKNKHGVFRALVLDNEDKDRLYTMANSSTYQAESV